MRLLALSTSQSVASAAVLQDGEIVKLIRDDSGRTHSEMLMPMVERCLNELGLELEAIDAIAVDTGPGSFTGVRIGVCAANAMAMALGKSVIGVDSLTALYHNVIKANGTVCALIDARNGNGYAALFKQGMVLDAPRAVVINEYIGTLPHDVLFVGDGSVVYAEEITKALPNAVFAQAEENLLLADAVAMAALKKLDSGETSGYTLPLYLRPSQAERVLKERQSKCK